MTFQARDRVRTGRDSPPQFGSGPREGHPRAPSQKPPRRPGPDGPSGLPPHVFSERCPNLSETRKVGSGDLSRRDSGDTGERRRVLSKEIRRPGWRVGIGRFPGELESGPDRQAAPETASCVCPRLTSNSPATRVLKRLTLPPDCWGYRQASLSLVFAELPAEH